MLWQTYHCNINIAKTKGYTLLSLAYTQRQWVTQKQTDG